MCMGGLVASLLDCHGTASAAAFAHRAEARSPGGGESPVRYVTASLRVDFRRPTPMGTELLITGRLRNLEGRKVWVDLALSAQGLKGSVFAVSNREAVVVAQRGNG